MNSATVYFLHTAITNQHKINSTLTLTLTTPYAQVRGIVYAETKIRGMEVKMKVIRQIVFKYRLKVKIDHTNELGDYHTLAQVTMHFEKARLCSLSIIVTINFSTVTNNIKKFCWIIELKCPLRNIYPLYIAVL